MFGSYAKPLGLKDNLPYIDPRSPQYLGYPVKVVEIGNGEEAAEKTVKLMIDIIKESSNNPYVRKWAEKLMQNVPARDNMAEASAIYYFIRDNCAYRPDPIDLEYLTVPPLALSKIEQNIIPQVDCDDMAMLACSLARSIGMPAALKITKYFNNSDWTHIYAMFLVGSVNDGIAGNGGKKWIPIDPIKYEKPFLWEAPNPTASKMFFID